MLSKCANPGCTATFHYLHEGRLFRLETGTEKPAGRNAPPAVRKLEFFWLCAECAEKFTLSYTREAGVTVARAQKPQARAAAAAGIRVASAAN